MGIGQERGGEGIYTIQSAPVLHECMRIPRCAFCRWELLLCVCATSHLPFIARPVNDGVGGNAGSWYVDACFLCLLSEQLPTIPMGYVEMVIGRDEGRAGGRGHNRVAL